MKKISLRLLAIMLSASCVLHSCDLKMNKNQAAKEGYNEEEEEKEGYDGPAERDMLEFEKTKDPATGIVPKDLLLPALEATEVMKGSDEAKLLDMTWIERGPIYDSVGPFNGNTRGGPGNLPGTYTSGRMRGVLVDPTDATGNTVWVGGVNGGIWKTTNLLSTIPNWQNINDFFDNMAVSSICIDPSNSNIMYFSTGEPTVNTDAVRGLGIWKSTDHGVTWNRLVSTTGFTLIFKILCDNSGNLYAALRSSGLMRSNDGGSTWTTISPSSGSCTDIELSSTGTLHASMGYYYASGGTARHYFTTTPATVNSAGWTSSTGLPSAANRLEMASVADTVWIVSTSSGNNVNNSYKSTDGGATFTKQNITTYSTSLSNTQGWYNISLAINPNTASSFIVGGIEAWRSVNDGLSISRMTFWITSSPYVHADQHFAQWWNVDGEARILLGCDGGLFLSRDNGASFADKNQNLGIKQFYSCAIHPTLPNYFLAGSQDNGSHRLNNPGLTYSTEVTGGDGAYVDIDQDEPQFQFTSYVYNQYRRSTNNWTTFTSFNFSNSEGLFINPFDYDDAANKLYASYGASLFRWNDPTTAISVATASTNILTVPFMSGSITALTTSPNVAKRLYVGTSGARLIRIDNADTVTNSSIAGFTTNISGPSFSGYLNCVAVGSDDQTLLAIFSNYGVTNVWHSTDGGGSWTGIDGNLPNMPVRWAVFDPTNNDKVIIATEAGVYVTRDINGGATQWLPSPDFPTVRTDMLKVRTSDNLILAATHGRGLWSSYTYTVVPVRNITLQARAGADGYATLNWNSLGGTTETKYVIQYSINGISFTNIETTLSNVTSYRHLLNSPNGYYRIMSSENGSRPVYSNVAFVKTGAGSNLTLRISPNPVVANAIFAFSSAGKGNYNWIVSDASGKTVLKGTGSLPSGGLVNLPLKTEALSKGTYYLQVVQEGQKVQATFIKQ